MRILYMVGGFSSTDALVLSKLCEQADEVCVLYTRPQPAAYPILHRTRNFWIDVSKLRWLPKTVRWFWFGFHAILVTRKIKPDILVAEGLQLHGTLAVLSGIRPILLLPWGSDWAIVAAKNRLSRFVSRFVARHVDMVQIDCLHGKRVLAELGNGRLPPEDIRVFPRGIELEMFQPDIACRRALQERLGWLGKKVLIMTRSHSPVYGVDLFLRALAKLTIEDPEVRALLVGDGPQTDSLKDLANELGLMDVVKFVGRVARPELASLLNAADVYVSTSFSDGTSLSLLEAMAVGLPVVVTDVPANLEWVEDGYNGFVARRGDVASIYGSLRRMIVAQHLWPVFGRRNRIIATQRADWTKNAEKFREMFADLLTSRGKLAAL